MFEAAINDILLRVTSTTTSSLFSRLFPSEAMLSAVSLVVGGVAASISVAGLAVAAGASPSTRCLFGTGTSAPLVGVLGRARFSGIFGSLRKVT